MIESRTSCGCKQPSQNNYNQRLTPIINNCEKTPKIAHIEGKGDYEVHALVDTNKGEAFLPITSTKAVYDECGNSLDNILKKLQDVLAEFNTTNTKFQDCNGNFHNLEMVLNCNVKVVDDFNTDSGAKALSARRGKILFDALNNQKSDVKFEDVEDGTLAVKIRDNSDLRQQFNELSERMVQYMQQCDILFSLLSDLAKPSLITMAKELSSRHILRSSFNESGNQLYCTLGFEWNLDTPNIEVIRGITSVRADLKWYDYENNELASQVIGEPDLKPISKDNPVYIGVPVPDEAEHATITVTVYYGELPLTSNSVTYYLQDEYALLEDFELIGVDVIEGIDNSEGLTYESKLDGMLIYSLDMYGRWQIENAPKIDTLYYSKTQMRAMGKNQVDVEVPLYYFDEHENLVQINRT